MRPIILHGHQRPLTCVVYNREGDLCFTSAKDTNPVVWITSNGERMGTYDGHTGTVYHLACNWDSTILVTGSADSTCRFWEIETGREIFQIIQKAPIRCVAFSEGEKMLLLVGDKAMQQQAAVFIYNMDEDFMATRNPSKQSDVPFKKLSGEHAKKINRALWADMNRQIITCADDGKIVRWDVESGEVLQVVQASKSAINKIVYSPDKTMIIAACADHNARLYDTKTLELQRTYETDRPINSAAVHPDYPVVLVGGGQDAMSVTTTAARGGKFETCYFGMVHEELLGVSKGHFGPINDLVISPDGQSFLSAAEEGYVRLHFFDESFIDMCKKLAK
eukprot:66974_1